MAIVTGGSRGIGRAVARKLAIGDYAVVINYLDSQPGADAAVGEILAASGTAVAVCADVTDELDVERLFGETIDAFGGVDVVVHAAARMIPGAVAGYDLVNQQASLQLRDGGAIVNFCSSAVGLSLPCHGAPSARDITVNTIALGLERPAPPADIANLVAGANASRDAAAGAAGSSAAIEIGDFALDPVGCPCKRFSVRSSRKGSGPP